MRDNKIYIVLIGIVLVFFLVMFLLFGVDNIKKESYSATILVGENTIWNLQNKKWNSIINRDEIEKLNWQEYSLYVDHEYFGNYYLWHDDKWYAFDKEHNAVIYNGNLVAYRSNFPLKVASFQEEVIDDYSIVYDVLEKNQLSSSSKFTTSSKVSFDFDGDGVLEKFYFISNAFPIDFEPENIFSIVFMVKDDVVYPIYTSIGSASSFNGCKPYMSSILDVDSDGVYEFILSCGRYSIEQTSHMLYQFQNKEFKIIVSN